MTRLTDWGQQPTKQFEFFSGSYDNCANQELKDQGHYYVKRTLDETDEVMLEALLREDADTENMAAVWARQGRIAEITVNDKSANCGLEHELLGIAFDDATVAGNGGFLPDIHDQTSAFVSLTSPPRQAVRIHEATQNCQILIGVDPAPPAFLKTLLLEACSGSYEMMFLIERERDDAVVHMVENILLAANHVGAAELLQFYGTAWYFCQCRDDTIKNHEECQKMHN